MFGDWLVLRGCGWREQKHASLGGANLVGVLAETVFTHPKIIRGRAYCGEGGMAPVDVVLDHLHDFAHERHRSLLPGVPLELGEPRRRRWLRVRIAHPNPEVAVLFRAREGPHPDAGRNAAIRGKRRNVDAPAG